MPVKKKRAAPKKRKYTQKQKQKQKQSVNVKVSTGGSGGGGTSFIPMPVSQAPQFDINQLLQGLGTIRPPPTVPAPIAEAIREPVAEVIPRDELRAARMGSLQGGIAAEPVRARKERSDAGTTGIRKSKATKSVMGFVDEPMMSGAVSEGEGLPRSQQYYRSSGYIPPMSAGRGKKVGYEDDIFGISRPKTSDIRGSSSFESTAPLKSNVVTMSDLMSSIGGGSAQQTGGGGGMSFAE